MCMYRRVCVRTCHGKLWRSKNNFIENSSFLQPCGSQGLNLGHQVLLSSEPPPTYSSVS